MITINNRVIGQISDVSVANDKEVVRLEFKCLNQVTELLKLTDSTVFINYQNGSTKDRYAVTDLTQDGEYVTFSWTLGANATKKQGKTFFVVCAVITEDEDVLQEWNTELAFFNVNKGLECETQPSEDMEDLFAQLTAMVEENASDITALEGSKQDKLIAGENITIDGNVISASGGGGGTSDYSRLTNKPSINSVELNGNKSLADLGIQPSGSYALSSDLTAEETARQNADSALQTAINGKADAFSVDDTTIADVNGTLKVKDGGIGAVQLSSAVTALIAGKQDALVSGTNIKTINGNSILGSGDLPISGGGTTYTAGQNISISAQNVISAGIEVIEI